MRPSSAASGTQREPIYVVIAQHIRNDIAAGKLRSGHQLPSTRELARGWGVSVEPVNRAMALLADEGLIVNRGRTRRIVSGPDAQLPEPVLRPQTPRVLLIGGFAGSGKTELGRILARQAGWPIFDKDTLTRPATEAALELFGEQPSDRESDTYLKVVRPTEYEGLRAAALENVECGVSAILTAPFIQEMSDRAWCDRTAATYDSLGAQLHLVWVHCDAETMRRYLRHRGAARDSWKMAHWEEYLTSIDVDYRPAVDHHLIENSAGSRPLQHQASELLKEIQ